jgi:ABC-type glycerol-3-phosphate transport system permease component
MPIYGGPPKCFNGFHIPLDFHRRGQQDLINSSLFDTPFALILTYPTILIPFSTWLLMGYLKTIPFELEERALIDSASR